LRQLLVIKAVLVTKKMEERQREREREREGEREKVLCV
jgi:protein subunit release factor B